MQQNTELTDGREAVRLRDDVERALDKMGLSVHRCHEQDDLGDVCLQVAHDTTDGAAVVMATWRGGGRIRGPINALLHRALRDEGFLMDWLGRAPIVKGGGR